MKNKPTGKMCIPLINNDKGRKRFIPRLYCWQDSDLFFPLIASVESYPEPSVVRKKNNMHNFPEEFQWAANEDDVVHFFSSFFGE